MSPFVRPDAPVSLSITKSKFGIHCQVVAPLPARCHITQLKCFSLSLKTVGSRYAQSRGTLIFFSFPLFFLVLSLPFTLYSCDSLSPRRAGGAVILGPLAVWR